MHYHCEVIMPKSKNIEKDLETIMEPFREENDSEDALPAFWDFYVVGGRWAGTKETCAYDAEKLEQFYIELKKREITVSGFRAGKETLQPSSQIPMVDKLWCEFFPTETGEIVACPLFSHSNNQYDSSDFISCDVCLVEEIPENLACSRVIIAGPSYDDKSIEAHFMLCDSLWNGVNHMDAKWDGNIHTALQLFSDYIKRYRKEYAEKITPQNDWLCITVDYHS